MEKTELAPFRVSALSRALMAIEVTLPILLLVLGIYHGFLQTLYRAGVIQSPSFAGLSYYQGLTLHGVINAVVLTTFFGVAFGNALVSYYLQRPPHPVGAPSCHGYDGDRDPSGGCAHAPWLG